MILKLKRTPGIYLVGFMASGKSTVGALLAEDLGWEFTDLDLEIEREQGCTIADIFRERGEAAFRMLESNALARQLARIRTGRPTVVALGGGAFVQPRNRETLEGWGVSIWLDCPVNRLLSRLQSGSERPLATDPERFEALYYERRPAYERADYRIEVVSEDPREAVAAILKLPIFE